MNSVVKIPFPAIGDSLGGERGEEREGGGSGEGSDMNASDEPPSLCDERCRVILTLSRRTHEIQV